MPANKQGEVDTGPHEPAAQPMDTKSSSKSDEGRPAILNQPTNVNQVYGTVQTITNTSINTNYVTNIVQEDILKEMVRSTDAN